MSHDWIDELLNDPALDEAYAEAQREDERDMQRLGYCHLGCSCENCKELDEELRK